MLGVFVATATYIPNQEVFLWLVRSFSIKMKWLAVIFVVIDLLSIPAANAGGHIAHIGGALFGWLFVVVMRHGSALRPAKPKIRKPKKTKTFRPLSDEEYNRRRADNQKRVDAILDKIS